MARHGCLNGTMVDTNRYSSPVPLIGLYTAAATLVCLTLILYDILIGFRRKKAWFPCRFFSLNSITLTLISISAKLPVDLTSPMPSSQDQLSKLTGTIFICMCMAFLMPSIGINGELEGYSNMVALSIFVVTVVVNVSIQMATGVIFSFIVEHIIILFCMLALLGSLWGSTFIINDYKECAIDKAKDILRDGTKGSLLQRMKVCYLHWYASSPQFAICRGIFCGTVSLICIICVVVQAEAVLRSLAFQDLKFCAGTSAYKWSMWSVVVSQIVTIGVISFAIGFRWVTYANFLNSFRNVGFSNTPYLYVLFPFYTPKWLHLFRYCYRFMLKPCAMMIRNFVIFITQNLGALVNRVSCKGKLEKRRIQDFQDLLKTHDLRVKEWILQKAVEDLEGCMDMDSAKHPHHLLSLLSEINPSLGSSTNKWFDLNEGNGVSCLSILLLVEMAKVSISNSSTVTLMEDILAEVFSIIYFIDKQISTGGINGKVRSMTAKILFTGKVTRGIMRPRPIDGTVQFQSELVYALQVISEFHLSFVNVAVRNEAQGFVSFFQHRLDRCTSLIEFDDQLKLLFIEILHALLSQLPKAILSHLVDGVAEDYEERVRRVLKYICRLEMLDSFVRWSFPGGCDITGLVHAPLSTDDSQNNNAEQNEDVCPTNSVNEGPQQNDFFTQDDLV